MRVWSPAFQHQFLDGNLLNFSAAPGPEPVILFDGPLVQPTPPPEQRGFFVRPGHRFGYAFEPAFDDVIGVDVKLDIAFPAGAVSGQLLGNVSLASGAVRLLLAFVSGLVRIQLFVGSDVTAVSVPLDQQGDPLRIHARWHTHGQGRILVNGSLRRYDPNLAAGTSFTIDRLSFGHHLDTVVPNASAFIIRMIGVKLLRRNGGGRFLDGLFPIADPSPLDEACKRQLAGVDRAISDELRRFMSAAIRRLTSNWEAGQAGGPFTPQAVAAHGAALATGRAFVQFMLGRRGGDSETIKQKLGEFLALIKATDPAGYEQAVARVQALMSQYDPGCVAQFQPLAQQHAASLKPMVALAQALWARIQSPEGPHA
jgi:hypothetical protein